MADAIEFLDMAGEQARTIDSPFIEMQVILDSGIPLALLGKMDDAMSRFKKAESLSSQMGAPAILVHALMNQGLVYYHSGGRYRQASAALRKAASVARKHAIRPSMVIIAVNLAQALFDLGNYRKALAIAEEGLALARQFGYRNFLVALQGNVALHRTMLGEWDQAAANAHEAMAMARHYRMAASIASDLHTFALLLAVKGDFQQSLNAQLSSLDQQLTLQNSGEAIGCLNEILAISLQLQCGNLAREIVESKQALTQNEAVLGGNAWSLGFRAHWSAYKVLEGETTLEVGHQDLESALSEADGVGSLWLLAEVGEVLVRMLRQAGKEEEAAVAGLRVYPKVMRHYCPLKVTPFLLTLAEALLGTDRLATAEAVLKILRRQAKILDRGLTGLRYRLILADAAGRQGNPRTASRARKEAKALAQGLVGLQHEEPYRSAVLALPEVRRALAFE